MINPEAKLANIFKKETTMKPTRDGYGEGLIIAGEENENVVVLCADLTESTRSEGFARKFPNRFFEIGVAEQNLATVAAGLGVSGKIPFISSYATFSPGRNYEQIRTTIAYNDSNVKIAGAHAGVSVGPDGATHQATEDIAIMRVMPNMRVFVPCDAIEARKMTIKAAKMWGPVYMRLGREKSPVITTDETPCVPGKAEIFWQSPTNNKRKPVCALIACGILVAKAMYAAEELGREGIDTIVVNNHTIKPLDGKKIIEVAKKCGAVVTLEEHQIKGGLGGAVAELLAEQHPLPMECIGLNDTFGESGAPDALMKKYGLDVPDIKKAVVKAVKRRK